MRRYLPILWALLLLLAGCAAAPASAPEETEGHTPVQEPDHHGAGEEPDHHGAPSAPAASQEPAPQGRPASPLPEKVARAGANLIRERVWRGNSAGTWLPLLADVTWADLAGPAGDDFDCVWEACADIGSYVADQGQALTEEEYRVLLTHVQGLDGAYAEGYAGVLYDLYVLNPARFARMVLDELSPDQREAALGGLLYDWGYVHELDEDMDPARRLETLAARLEEDKKGEPAASPDVMRFDYEGQSARLLPVNVPGVYAASYTSDRPEVASVDGQTGVVTAVGPGEAVITLHFEGNGENRDFTCPVRCAWQRE